MKNKRTNERTNEKKMVRRLAPYLCVYYDYDYDYDFGLFTFISSRSYDTPHLHMGGCVASESDNSSHEDDARHREGWMYVVGDRILPTTTGCLPMQALNWQWMKWVRKEEIDDIDGRTPAHTTCLWEPRNPTVPPIPVRAFSRLSSARGVGTGVRLTSTTQVNVEPIKCDV